jgi:DNA-binding NtrC family response regulator
VVDDEVSVGQFTTVRLEQQNFRAVVMVESQRALAAVRATPQRFDAIVTDHMMPGLTGVELIREIRHLRPGLPAVIVTGNRSALPADLLATMPRLVVLDKPFTGEDVARALHTVLNPAAAP